MTSCALPGKLSGVERPATTETALKLSIITPCYNAKDRLAETIQSVITQPAVLSGRVTLQYLICDGLSTDGTVDVARSFEDPAITVLSEKDRGMYDALAKGLKRAEGDVVAYINAGDYYHKSAFDVIADIFEGTDTDWLTGYASSCDHRSAVVAVHLPYRYRQSLFRCGYYGRKLPFVQQESTFWRRNLLDLVDYERLAGFRYAGDFYLWHQFSAACQLRIVEALIGVYKIHPGQLSENMDAYFAEMGRIAGPIRWKDRVTGRIDRILWQMPRAVKKRNNPNGLYLYDRRAGAWR